MTTALMNANNSEFFQQEVLSNLQRIEIEFPLPPPTLPLVDFSNFKLEVRDDDVFNSSYPSPSLSELQCELSRLKKLPFIFRIFRRPRIVYLQQEIDTMLSCIQQLQTNLSNLKKLVTTNSRLATLEKMLENTDSLNKYELAFIEKRIAHHRDEIYISTAKAVIKRETLRKHICAALEKASDDIFEIAKIITPLLIGLVSSGIVQMNLTPLLVAAIAFAVSRIGVASLCIEDTKNK